MGKNVLLESFLYLFLYIDISAFRLSYTVYVLKGLNYFGLKLLEEKIKTKSKAADRDS